MRKPSKKRLTRKKNKYNAIRVDGFGSKVEKARFEFLERLEQLGKIDQLKKHPKIIVTPEGWPEIVMIPDAVYFWNEKHCWIYEDTKGSCITDVFRLKCRLFVGKNPNATFGMLVAKARRKSGKIVGWNIFDYKVLNNRLKPEKIMFQPSVDFED